MHNGGWGPFLRSCSPRPALTSWLATPIHWFRKSPELNSNWSCYSSADLKQTNCQVFLQQRWVYSGSAENCNWGPTNVIAMCKFPHSKGRKSFYREEKEVGGARVIEEPVASHWLSPHQEKNPSSSYWDLLWHGTWVLPLLVSRLLFNWDFYLLIFK